MKVTAGKPSEFRFTVSRKRLAKGVVVFRVTNRGSISCTLPGPAAAGMKGVVTVT